MKITGGKIKVISEISRDIAQIFFGLVFLGPLVTGQIDWVLIVFGLSLSVAPWILSIILIK